MKWSSRVLVALASCAVAGPVAPLLAQRPGLVAAKCVLDAGTAAWLQRVFDGWDRVSSDALKLGSAPLPWMVFYDEQCAWHIGFDARELPGASPIDVDLTHRGARVAVHAQRHAGTVWLPDGSLAPARENTARASLYRDSTAAYFVMATPAMWRREPSIANDPDADTFFLGVAIHELTHTRHLPLILARVKAVASQYQLTNVQLDDDVVQKTFEARAGFREAFELERDLLYAAVAEPDHGSRRMLIRRALDMAHARRARYYTGQDRYFREFEDIFLCMEGLGQWAAYVQASRSNGNTPRRDPIAFVRDNRKYWSQEEGLALFLLLDLESSDWRSRVFTSEAVDLFALLDATLNVAR